MPDDETIKTQLPAISDIRLAINEKHFGLSRSQLGLSRLDVNKNPLEAGGIYRLTTGGNALVVEITADGERFLPVPSFFAGFFRIPADPLPFSTLAGHCQFVPFRDGDDQS